MPLMNSHDLYYCGEAWCDGHLFSAQRCEEQDQPTELVLGYCNDVHDTAHEQTPDCFEWEPEPTTEPPC